MTGVWSDSTSPLLSLVAGQAYSSEGVTGCVNIMKVIGEKCHLK